MVFPGATGSMELPCTEIQSLVLALLFGKSTVYPSGLVKKQLVITCLEAKGKFRAEDVNLGVST